MSTRARAGKLQVVESYKVVAHQERISFFGGNGLGETLLHRERLVARGVCGRGGHRLEHAHHGSVWARAPLPSDVFFKRRMLNCLHEAARIVDAALRDIGAEVMQRV